MRVVNHTLLLIRSVSRLSTKYHFSEVKPSQMHFWEPLTRSFSRKLLVRVVNHTLLLIRSVSRFSTKYHFSEVKLSQTHCWEPPSLSSAVTRACSKSHTTPNTECDTILYRNISSVRSTPHRRTVKNLRVFSRQLLVRVVNHTLLPIWSVSRLSTEISVQWGQTLTDALLRTTEFVLGSYSCA